MKNFSLIVTVLLLWQSTVFTQEILPADLYFGQTPPGDTPEIFAPGIISTTEDIYGFEISPSGAEMIYTRPTGIHIIQFKSGKWSDPEVISFSKTGNNGECCFSRDGSKIYFNSRRSCPESEAASNIWISDRTNNGWSEPYYSKLSKPGATVHSVSVASNGNIYCDGVTKFVYENWNYSEAQKLSPEIKGAHVFIASDESYILFDQRYSGRGTDIFISFTKPDGTWTTPVALDNINTTSSERQPFVSGDGKYFFFTRNNKVYWVKADFIKELKTAELSQ